MDYLEASDLGCTAAAAFEFSNVLHSKTVQKMFYDCVTFDRSVALHVVLKDVLTCMIIVASASFSCDAVQCFDFRAVFAFVSP